MNCGPYFTFLKFLEHSAVLWTFAIYSKWPKNWFLGNFFKILPYFWFFFFKILAKHSLTLMYVWTHLGFSLDWSFNRHWQLKLRLNQATSYLLSRRWFRLLTTIEVAVALEKFFGKSENYRLVPYSIRDNFPLPNF